MLNVWRNSYEMKRVIGVSEYDALFDEDNDSADLPKKLRAKIKELQKERDEYAEKFAAFEEKERQGSLASALQSKGFNPKIAAFVPKDATTPEALDEWLNEFGDVFGGQPQAQQAQPAQAAEANRMAIAEQGASQAPPADIMARIEGAENMDELMAALGRQ